MEKIGIYTDEKRKERVWNLTGGCPADILTPQDCTADEAVRRWATAGTACAVIDDDALTAGGLPEEGDGALLEAIAADGAPRCVFLSETRDVEDPLCYRLVSMAGVSDMAVAAAGIDVEARLAEMVEVGSGAADVLHWMTEDRAKLGTKKFTQPKRRVKRGNRSRAEARPDAPEEAVEPAAPEPEHEPEEMRAGGDLETEAEADGTDDEADRGPEEEPAARDGGAPEGNGEPGNAGPEPEPERRREPERGPEAMKARGKGKPAREQRKAKRDVERRQEVGKPKQARSEGGGSLTGASLMAGLEPRYTAPRRVDEQERLTCPTARNVIAVAAASGGIGCTHLACALAMELSRAGAAAACAIYDPVTFEAFRATVAPDSKRSDAFMFAGVAFYKWDAQRPHSADHDVVVCDCGRVDYPDDDPNSPASLFGRTTDRAMLVSGAPWTLQDASDAITARTPEAVAATTWMVASAGRAVVANIAAAVEKAAKGRAVEVLPVPWRPELMTGDDTKAGEYGALLRRARDSALGASIEPAEYARRNGRKR